MTRFYTNVSSSVVWSRLQQVVKKLGYESRTSPDKVRIQYDFVHVDDCICVPTLVFNSSIKTLVFNSGMQSLVIVIARLSEIYGSKPSEYEGEVGLRCHKSQTIGL